MIVDYLFQFADATSVGTPNNTTVNCGSQVDLQAAGANLGDGKPLYFVVQVTTAITSGGAATVSFLLSSDSTASIAVDGNQTIHLESDVIAKATLVAGYTLAFPVPLGISNTYERYLGCQVRENAGQALTGGAINAFITDAVQSWRAVPNAI